MASGTVWLHRTDAASQVPSFRQPHLDMQAALRNSYAAAAQPHRIRPSIAAWPMAKIVQPPYGSSQLMGTDNAATARAHVHRGCRTAPIGTLSPCDRSSGMRRRDLHVSRRVPWTLSKKLSSCCSNAESDIAGAAPGHASTCAQLLKFPAR
jgi:hypothetical protein